MIHSDEVTTANFALLNTRPFQFAAPRRMYGARCPVLDPTLAFETVLRVENMYTTTSTIELAG
jgi:hypothetical protein